MEHVPYTLMTHTRGRNGSARLGPAALSLPPGRSLVLTPAPVQLRYLSRTRPYADRPQRATPSHAFPPEFPITQLSQHSHICKPRATVGLQSCCSVTFCVPPCNRTGLREQATADRYVVTTLAGIVSTSVK